MQKRTFLKSALALGVALSAAPILTACSKAEPEKQAAAQAPAPAAAEAPKLKPIKVAVTAGPHADIVTKAAEVAKKQGFDVKVVEFTDYITPDTALAEKQLDVAVYQHEPFLLNFNKQKGTDLVVAANAVVQPMGLYSNKIHSLDDIKADTKIAIPNDPSNGGRALVLLEKAGIIKLKPDYKGEASIHDVAENPRGVKLVELEAAQLPISLQDLDVACVPMNYAVSGGLDVNKQGFYFESRDAKYALIIIAARPDNVQSPEVQTFVKCYQSPRSGCLHQGKVQGTDQPGLGAARQIRIC